MKKFLFLLIIISFIGLGVVKMLILTPQGWKTNVTSPIGLESASPNPVASISGSTPTPRTFKYDKNTDLKKELEKVDPQILDSDFN